MSAPPDRATGEATARSRKTIAVMQPYFLPYIGYWQMMQAVDEFVIYDDVQFSKGGWINRNRLFWNGAAEIFTLPLRKGSMRFNINERYLANNWPEARRSLLDRVSRAYSDAPHFAVTFPVIERIFQTEERNLADFLHASIAGINACLGISTRLLRASELEAGQGARGAARLIALCKARGAGVYVNAPGGRDLYDREDFGRHGICLKFIQPDNITYRQFDKPFVPSLSILDVMMFNARDDIRELLGRYTLT